MSIKKINLSALNGQNNTQTDSEITSHINVEKSETVIEENTVPQVKIEAVEDTQINNKRKISLRDLKKSHVSLKEENQVDNTEVSESTEIQNTFIASETKQEIVEAPLVEVKNEDENISTQIQSVKEEVFTITDGDTNCNIVKEEKSEIFGNYKGSFSKNDTSDEVVVAEVVAPVEEAKKETKKSERKMDHEKTNLERYADGEDKSKKSLKKKILFSGLASVLAVSIPGVIFLQGGFLKSNVSELKKVPTETEIQIENTLTDAQLPIETQIEVTPQTQEINTNVEVKEVPEVQTENNQVGNTDIVKENIVVEVANTQKNTKIDQKLHNYLLEKYKK